MTTDGGDTTDAGGPLDSIETGLDALFAVEVVEEILEAVDFEALEAGASYEQAVDHDRLGRAIGQPVGRLVVRRVFRQATGGGLAGVVGREIAGRVGASAVRIALELTDPDAVLGVLETLEETARETMDGAPAADERVVDIEIEDGEE